MLGDVGIRAGQEHPEIGRLRTRRPHLLTGDDPLVTVFDRPRGETGEIRAGTRLAEQLGPGLLPAERVAHVALLLLVVALHRDRRAREQRPEALRRAEHAVLGDGGLHPNRVATRQPATEHLDRELRRGPTRVGENLPPLAHREVWIPVLVEPRLHFVGDIGVARQSVGHQKLQEVEISRSSLLVNSRECDADRSDCGRRRQRSGMSGWATCHRRASTTRHSPTQAIRSIWPRSIASNADADPEPSATALVATTHVRLRRHARRWRCATHGRCSRSCPSRHRAARSVSRCSRRGCRTPSRCASRCITGLDTTRRGGVERGALDRTTPPAVHGAPGRTRGDPGSHGVSAGARRRHSFAPARSAGRVR